MPISESILRPILLDYEDRRFQAKVDLEQREKEVHSTVPRIAEIDQELDSFGLNALRSAVSAGSDRQKLLEELRSRNRRLVEEKTRLLAEAGYAPDYLELHYTCPLCRDTGYVEGRRCRCLQQKLISRAYQQSNLEKVLSRDNFSTFNLSLFSAAPCENEPVSPRENARRICQTARDYVQTFSEDPSQNLLLYGTPGTGKTFLCSCIAKELLDQGYSVLYLTSYELCSTLEACRFRNKENPEAPQALQQLLEDCDLLILDDLGTEFNTSLSVADLFHYVNQRLIRRQATIISTNLTLNQIAKVYTDRMASRICGNYRLLKFYGPDLRLRS